MRGSTSVRFADVFSRPTLAHEHILRDREIFKQEQLLSLRLNKMQNKLSKSGNDLVMCARVRCLYPVILFSQKCRRVHPDICLFLLQGGQKYQRILKTSNLTQKTKSLLYHIVWITNWASYGKSPR